MMNDAKALLDQLATARTGWMTGQLDRVALVGMEPAEANLTLLAMDGQFRTVLAAPHIHSDLRFALPLPAPMRPYPSDPARERFRQLMEGRLQDAKMQVLGLLDQRGYQAHPFDFMPELQWDGLPEPYQPLLAWQRVAQGAAPAATVNTYSRESVQSRFRDLCSVDPQQAEAWLRAELGLAHAVQRLRLLQDISPLLTAQNIGLLGELAASDRATKVMSFARLLLRRFGVASEGTPDLDPLDYIERSKAGLLRRRLLLTAPVQMNPTRRNLLLSCLGQIGLHQFAAHFGLDNAGLIAAWDWKNSHAQINHAVMVCVMTTGSDAACLSIWQDPDVGPELRTGLEPQHLLRLPASVLTDYVTALLRLPADQPGAALACLNHLRRMELDLLNPEQSALLWKHVARHPDLVPSGADNPGQDQRVRETIFGLAMVLHPTEAKAALERLLATGVHSADPQLAPLHLNLALSPMP